MGGREERGGWSDGGIPWLRGDERWFMTSIGFLRFLYVTSCVLYCYVTHFILQSTTTLMTATSSLARGVNNRLCISAWPYASLFSEVAGQILFSFVSGRWQVAEFS